MAKKASPTPPPTVLVLTLEQDGTGTLLARRGDLAHLSAFTYHSLTEIVAAIQNGANQLIAVEQNPPNVDAAPVSDSGSATQSDPTPDSAESENAADSSATPSDDSPAEEEPSGARHELDLTSTETDLTLTPTDLLGVTSSSTDPQPKLL